MVLETARARVAPFLKALIFSIDSLNLALRIESVYKVLNAIPIYGSGLNGVGIVHMGDREITVLDLRQQLLQSPRSNTSFSGDYLVIVQNTTGELYGIPTETVPILIDIPLSNIRILPESFRHADTLGIASHVAVVSQSETTLTLFLLDSDLTAGLARKHLS